MFLMENGRILDRHLLKRFFRFWTTVNSLCLLDRIFVKTMHQFQEIFAKMWKNEKFADPQAVSTHIQQCGKYGNLLSSHFFGKNFVKVTAILKKLQTVHLTKFFVCESKFLSFTHCSAQCGKTRNSLPRKKFRQTNFRVKLFSRILV